MNPEKTIEKVLKKYTVTGMYLQISVVNTLLMTMRDCINKLLKIFPGLHFRQLAFMNLYT